jgi:hypothetical protein
LLIGSYFLNFTIVNPLINAGLQQIVVWNHVATGQYHLGPWSMFFHYLRGLLQRYDHRKTNMSLYRRFVVVCWVQKSTHICGLLGFQKYTFHTDVVLVFACLKQNLLSMPIGNKAGYDIFFVVLYWTNRMSPTKILQLKI